jgi:1,4-dihydroxy-2-naphthoate octaprenyltransferase
MLAIRAQQVLSVIRLGRPKFLLGGFALYGLGALSAVALHFPFSLDAFIWGQVAVTAIQLTTHYSNDYFDYHADVANVTPTQWSGGSRVLVRGEVPRSAALITALVMAAGACLAVAVLVLHLGNPPAICIPIFGAMLVLSWSYSSPPLRLHMRGMGPPTVAIVVPFLTPVSGFILQANALHWLPILLTLPLVTLQLNMLVTLEFPDEQGDRSVGKHTWVILFGASRVALLSVVLIAAAFIFSFTAAGRILPPSVGWAWLGLTPLALFHAFRMLRGDWKRSSAWGSLAFGSVALFFLAIVADLLALAYIDSSVSDLIARDLTARDTAMSASRDALTP